MEYAKVVLTLRGQILAYSNANLVAYSDIQRTL